MKRVRHLVLMMFSCFLMTKVYSQEGLYFHLGTSIPVSDFGSDDKESEDAGRADIGVNLAFKYIYPLSISGLGAFGGVDLSFNPLQKGVRSAGFSYINVPISAGLHYTYQAEGAMGVYANAGLALNFLKLMDMSSFDPDVEADVATNLGFRIGGGLISSKTSLSFDYWPLGTHHIVGRVKSSSNSQTFDLEGDVDLMTVTFGFQF